jgi:threonine 3-dehydrogenase
VRADTTIPFMAMPDAAAALRRLAATPRQRLSRTAYNVGAFSRSAADIREAVVAAFPHAEITYKIDLKRQGIVDSWPADVDDSAARTDWGYAPAYDFDRAFHEYLIPTIRNYYRS